MAAENPMKDAKDFFNQQEYDRLINEGVTNLADLSSLPVPDDPDAASSTSASTGPKSSHSSPSTPPPFANPNISTQRGGISRRDFFWGGIVLGVAAIGGVAYLSQREHSSITPTSVSKLTESKPTVPPARPAVSSPEPKSSEQPVTKTYPVYRLIEIGESADVALTTVDILRDNMVRFNVLTSKRTADASMKCDNRNNDQAVYLTYNDKKIYPIETFCTSRRGQLILAWGMSGNNVSLYSWAVFSGKDVDLSKDLSFKWYGFGEIDSLNISSPKTKPPDSIPSLNANQTLKEDHVWAMLVPQIEQNWGNDWNKVNNMLTQFMKAYPRSFYERDVSAINRVAQDKFLTAKYEFINKLLSEQRLDEARSQFKDGNRVSSYFERSYWAKVESSLDPYWDKDWASVEKILSGYLLLDDTSKNFTAKKKLAVALDAWGRQLAAEGKCNEAADKFEQAIKIDGLREAYFHLQKLPCITTH